jgi:hypothetical protein
LPTDEEIRALCVSVLEAKSSDDFSASIRNLRMALNEHLLEIENMGIHLILNMPRKAEPQG